MSYRILIVDDEEFNLKILKNDIKGAGYVPVLAHSGEEALDILNKDSDFDLILLDRMMPGIDGIEVMQHIKNDKKLKHIPVIMQTAAAAQHEIKEGISAGVYYYLPKPFEEELMLALVKQAIASSRYKSYLSKELKKQGLALGLMEEAVFCFQTPEHVNELSYLIASSCPDPEQTASGLSELMMNAVEHGNLGFSYEIKKQLLTEGKWEESLYERLDAPEHIDKRAKIHFKRYSDKIVITIFAEGSGFDFTEYTDFVPERMTDPNGRGIATAAMTSFNEINYKEKGNVVECVIYLANKKWGCPR